jgi:hypothetical protein
MLSVVVVGCLCLDKGPSEPVQGSFSLSYVIGAEVGRKSFFRKIGCLTHHPA